MSPRWQRIAPIGVGPLPSGPMDLSGTWRAAIADDDLRRNGIGLDVDDSGWLAVDVPGHWRSTPALADSDGPLIYRTRFHLDPPPAGRRCFVTLDGVFYQADVWLDGAYLGDPEGYFVPHTFDITALSRLATEHVLAVEVACHPPSDLRAKRSITGIFQHWDSVDPAWNPGGLWRPVRIETTGVVRIDRVRVLCRDANDARAHLRVHGRLDSDASRSVRVRTTVDGVVLAEQEHPLARGMNEVDWNLDVENPRLWWPWALGEQPLVDVRIDVLVDGEISDERTVRTGLREVGMQDWTFTVNGERLFVKGANLGPTRIALGEVAPAELRRDVELAKEAGLDLIRLHGHISRPEIYAAADELGMLVWQDFPLQWGYARSVRKQAVRQAAEAVNLLGHHPSIVAWCGHNEPLRRVATLAGNGASASSALSRAAAQQLPTWNKTVLDRWVKRAFEHADDTRPVIAHSGILPHLPQLDGTDAHLSLGWHHGDERDLPGLAATMPRLVRFVGSFGAQAAPTTADFMQPEKWPALDWELLGERHAMQTAIFEQRVPPAEHHSFESWRDASQHYQADVIRHHIETLRRLKYRPTGGFCLYLFADAAPAVSWSVLDHHRMPKLGYHALAEACRPVVAVSDRMPETVSPGQAIALDIHVVSDLRHPLAGAELTALLRWPDGGTHEWRFGGDIPADDCVRIGTVQFVAPDAPGDLWLDLTLHTNEIVSTNRSTTTIVPRSS